MATLRYLKGEDAGSSKRSHLRHTVRSIRVLYETDPEIARALLPQPLRAAEAPEVFIQFANVRMQLAADRTLEVGAATVGIKCTYDGEAGYYVLTMPMEGEFVVIAGRERFGEPKKLAKTTFVDDGQTVRATVTRHGVTFLELAGRIGEGSSGPRAFEEKLFCFKGMPAIDPENASNGGFDGDVFLTRLRWERDYESLRTLEDPEVTFRESAHDPLVDVPVRRLIRMEYATGATRTSGEIVRTVPGEWLRPFLCQRYDTPQRGVELSLASEAGAA